MSVLLSIQRHPAFRNNPLQKLQQPIFDDANGKREQRDWLNRYIVKSEEPIHNSRFTLLIRRRVKECSLRRRKRGAAATGTSFATANPSYGGRVATRRPAGTALPAIHNCSNAIRNSRIAPQRTISRRPIRVARQPRMIFSIAVRAKPRGTAREITMIMRPIQWRRFPNAG